MDRLMPDKEMVIRERAKADHLTDRIGFCHCADRRYLLAEIDALRCDYERTNAQAEEFATIIERLGETLTALRRREQEAREIIAEHVCCDQLYYGDGCTLTEHRDECPKAIADKWLAETPNRDSIVTTRGDTK